MRPRVSYDAAADRMTIILRPAAAVRRRTEDPRGLHVEVGADGWPVGFVVDNASRNGDLLSEALGLVQDTLKSAAR